MHRSRPLHIALVALAPVLHVLVFPTTAAAEESTGSSLEQELREKYPRPPKAISADTASSLLLVDFDFKGMFRFHQLVGASLTKSNTEVIRAAAMRKRLVLFHGLAPDSYALRFVRAGSAADVVIKVSPEAAIRADVTAGKLHYLGTVVMSKKFGLSPPEVALVYDVERELKAWEAFLEKYPESTWSVQAAHRIQALRSAKTPTPP